MQNDRLITNIPWEEIKTLVDGKYKAFFEQIDLALYPLVLDNKNEQLVRQSIFKLLKNDKTSTATQENIDEIYNLLKKVAQLHKDMHLS